MKIGKSSSEREPVYETIPREEWERRHSALDARSQISEDLEEFEDDIVASFGEVKGSPTDFGVRVKVPKTSKYDLEDVENKLPSETTGEVNGVQYHGLPIIVEYVENGKSSYTYQDFDQIPGGQRVGTIVNSGSQIEKGTIMGRFDSDQYGNGLATAGHVLNSNGKDVYEIIGSNNQREKIGTARNVVDGDNIDCGFIQLTESDTSIDKITSSDNSYKELDIKGFYKDEALNYHAGQDNTLNAYIQGKESGRQPGYITETLADPTEAVVIDTPNIKGDSGGPIFEIADDGTYMIGSIVSHWGILGDKTRGTTVQTIEDTLGGDIY